MKHVTIVRLIIFINSIGFNTNADITAECVGRVGLEIGLLITGPGEIKAAKGVTEEMRVIAYTNDLTREEVQASKLKFEELKCPLLRRRSLRRRQTEIDCNSGWTTIASTAAAEHIVFELTISERVANFATGISTDPKQLVLRQLEYVTNRNGKFYFPGYLSDGSGLTGTGSQAGELKSLSANQFKNYWTKISSGNAEWNSNTKVFQNFERLIPNVGNVELSESRLGGDWNNLVRVIWDRNANPPVLHGVVYHHYKRGFRLAQFYGPEI